MSLFPLASLSRRLRMVSRPRTWLARPAPSARAQLIHRISVQVGQAPLDLGRQAELLWDALAQVVNPRTKALLLLCPEWTTVAMVEPSAPQGLSRTQLRLSAPIISWLGNQASSTARGGEMVVVPQLRDTSSQERELFERLEAEILVPLRVDGALSGVLVLGAKIGKDGYQPEERELLAGVAHAVARNMENARMHAVQGAKVAELQSVNEAQSDYILAISHQLKTPIAAVKASAEMLADSPADSRIIRELLASAIARGVDSLDRLVTELTEYGKMRHATLELHRVETDLSSLVTETCAMLQPLVDEKGLRLRLDVAPTLPWVMADPHRVQQVISNLLSNAIRFTPAGGEILVRTRQDGDR
ncbi:MAG: histidine kinase dimerization/phospho-acceptor domain-containing protein, partial [Chloroflexota bacterium]